MKTKDARKSAILESLKGGLIVSCQVQKDDPIYTDDIVVKMAEAARWAGAVGIRANSPDQRYQKSSSRASCNWFMESLA